MEDQVPDVPLVFISNAYLEKKAQSVEQRPILWEVIIAIVWFRV